MARCTSIAAVGLFLALSCPSVTSAATITWVPSDLNPGATYHLAFATSTTRDATSSDITDYNTFVDNAMGTKDDNESPYGDITWKCIGSTSSVDARDNIGYSSSSAPVYRLDGTRVADSSDDLWDGTALRGRRRRNAGPK